MFFGFKRKPAIDQAEAERLGRIVVNGVKRMIAAGASEKLTPGVNEAYAAIHGAWYDQVGRDLVAAGFRDLGPFRTGIDRGRPPEKDSYYRLALSGDGLIAASWFMVVANRPKPWVVLHSFRPDDSACCTASGVSATTLPVPPESEPRRLPEGAPVAGMVKLHRRDMERTGGNFLRLDGAEDMIAARNRHSLAIRKFRESKGIAICEPYLRGHFKDAYPAKGALVLAAIMANQEWWTGEQTAEKAAAEARPVDDGRSGPYDLTARFYQHVEPIDRGAWYEDPLQAALDGAKAGTVTGGGSQLNAQGGIDFAEIEIEVPDRHEAVRVVIDALEAAGAPQGSELRWGNGVLREFGKTQCLAVFLDGVGLPDEVYAALDFEALVAQLEAAAGPRSHRGVAQGPGETGLFFFGADAEAMFERVEPVLRQIPIGRNARVVIRYGKPSLNPRTVRMPA